MIPRPQLFLLFFASGLAALAYEVVWIRVLTLTLSITVYALTTVLCAFMAGLGLGAVVGAAVADKVRRPLLLFGVVEFGIALSGLIAPPVLFGLGPVYVWLHGALGGQGLLFDASRFALCFVILLLPTGLMGVTLPLLSRVAIHRKEVAGEGAGGLYAANTMGAVLGCVAAGFLLIPELGLQTTSLFAALVNICVGTIAVARGRRLELPLYPIQRHEPPPRMAVDAKLATFAFGISGFTALGYEVLWTRALEHYTHNSTYAYSAMLATFLFGLASGSAVASRIADRLRRPLFGVGLLQIGIGASVLFALLLYMRFETIVPAIAGAMGGLTSWPRVVFLIFGEAGLTMLPSTLLLGAMFPVVARTVVDSMGTVGRRVGTAYVVNTVGSIAGSLLVGFAVLPQLGMRGAFVSLICVNLALGVAVVLGRARGMVGLSIAGAALSMGLLVFLLLPSHLFERQFAERFGEIRFYKEEVTDTVMVTENDEGNRVIRYADGRGTAGTMTYVEDRMYAHIPMLLHPKPRTVLQIGFGVGNTLSSVVQHPVERVVCVELSPGVVEAAPWFRTTNRDVLADPRVTLVIRDGRNYLLTSREKFDVIRMDPPELHTAGVVNLYTREFYQLALDHLAEGGIFSVWINNVMTPEEDIRALVRTLQSVFPHVSLWHGPAMYSWVFNASVDPHAPDLALLLRQFADPRVRADLDSIGIPDPFHLLSHFVMGNEELEEYAGPGPLVVDDHTRLDFTVPRSENAFYGIANFNTEAWLVNFMQPDSKRDVAQRIFLRTVAQRASRKRPVLPHVVGLEQAGFEREEVGRRIEAASQKLLVH